MSGWVDSRRRDLHADVGVDAGWAAGDGGSAGGA
jgi:hypothetical protein